MEKGIELNEFGLLVFKHKTNKRLFLVKSYIWVDRITLIDETEGRQHIMSFTYSTFDLSEWTPMTVKEYSKVVSNFKEIYEKIETNKKNNHIVYLDDLSYSNIVNLIQCDEIKGANILNSIAQEMEDNNKIIEKLENDLLGYKLRKNTLIEGSKNILKHLKKEVPLAVQRQGYIIVVSDNNISIERNVI